MSNEIRIARVIAGVTDTQTKNVYPLTVFAATYAIGTSDFEKARLALISYYGYECSDIVDRGRGPEFIVYGIRAADNEGDQ